jgi:hypothetical protein
MFRPNGIGDLQKGERCVKSQEKKITAESQLNHCLRYCNMDAIFLMSVIRLQLLILFISYDIACQWYKNFFARMHAMPSELHLPISTTIHFRVPKFHLPAHVQSCHAPFSFNFTEGVGKTDGEAPERKWSTFNNAAASLSMMSHGGRMDTMADQANGHNYDKVVKTGELKSI